MTEEVKKLAGLRKRERIEGEKSGSIESIKELWKRERDAKKERKS